MNTAVHRRVETEMVYRSLLVNRLNDEFLVGERYVANFTPWKADLWCQPEHICQYIHTNDQKFTHQCKLCSNLYKEFTNNYQPKALT